MYAPVVNVGVVMDCQGAGYRATTDADGRFTISGVPVGWCTPRLELPASDALLFVREISIPDPSACAEIDLIVGIKPPP